MISSDPNVRDEFTQDLFSTIYNMNYAIGSRIMHMNRENDIELLQNVYDTLMKERVCDKPPARLSFAKCDLEDSCRTHLRYAYNATKPADPEEIDGYITVGAVTRKCDLEVARLANALLKTSISKNPEETQACKTIISMILELMKVNTAAICITKGMVLTLLNPVKGKDAKNYYYYNELVKEIYSLWGEELK